MIFKFGLLVLLLALDGVFTAEKQQQRPTFRDVDVVPYIEQLKHFSIVPLRMRRSKVQGPFATNFASSTQSAEPTCAWDTASKKCALSNSIIKSLLAESDTEFAKIFFEDRKCVEQTNKEDCNNIAACIWSETMAECVLGDPVTGHEDSPCVKAAPRIFDGLKAPTVCGKQYSGTDCKSKRQSHWIPELYFCMADFSSIISRIDNFMDKAAKVTELIKATLKSHYLALAPADDFIWQSLFDSRPSIQCPSGIEQLVCDSTAAYWSRILGQRFYCSKKYESNSTGCDADVLCWWSTYSAKCRSFEDWAYFLAPLASEKVLIDSLPEGTDKSFLETSNTCTGIFEGETCHGKCTWNRMENLCRVSSHYIAPLLTKPGKNSTDAFCAVLALRGFSGCLDQFTKADCEKIEICYLSAPETCEPKDELFLSKAAEFDPKLKDKYLQVKKRCSRHTTPRDCVEPSKVY